METLYTEIQKKLLFGYQILLLLIYSRRRVYFCFTNWVNRQKPLLEQKWDRKTQVRELLLCAPWCSALHPRKISDHWVMQCEVLFISNLHWIGKGWGNAKISEEFLFYFFLICTPPPKCNWKEIKLIWLFVVYQANDSLRQFPMGLALHFGYIPLQWQQMEYCS